jgi:predicted lipoprotein with Yx(FWY)xxD motif
MKAVWTVIIVVIVLAVVGYGGYKMYHHMTRQTAPAMTAVRPSMKAQPTMASNSVYKVMPSGKLGSIFTDTKGMTLYTYKKDTSGVSNCSGACLKAWPAYVASSQTGTFPTSVTVIKRTDGTLQYAWKGMPLYYYVGDKKAGDVNGEGIEGAWDVVKQ